MEQKRTPGPWTLETQRTSSGICHKIGPFSDFRGKKSHACIYDDYPPDGGSAELLANAHLIAAAPELLEAARALIELEAWITEELGLINQDIDEDERARRADNLAREWFGAGIGASYQDDIGAARAVIAKAENTQ